MCFISIRNSSACVVVIFMLVAVVAPILLYTRYFRKWVLRIYFLGMRTTVTVIYFFHRLDLRCAKSVTNLPCSFNMTLTTSSKLPVHLYYVHTENTFVSDVLPYPVVYLDVAYINSPVC